MIEVIHGLSAVKRWPIAAWVAVACIMGIAAFIAAMATARSLFNVGVEIDTLVSFIPEARLLARLDPLQVKYHLPGYSMALGVAFVIFKDWLVAGLVVSVAAASFALAASYHLFERLWGPAAGLGAIAGLGTSAEFLAYGAQATSDIPFLAAYVGSLMFAARAFRSSRALDWAATGAFVAVTILMRTNGIALLPLLFLPFLMSPGGGRRKRDLVVVLGAFAAVAALWALYSLATGTPLLPQRNHVNLALTYYSTGARQSADEMARVSGLFSSTTELILADPVRILRIYWQDLRSLPGSIATRLVWPPVLLLALGGFWLWWRDRHNPAAQILAVVTIASLLLLNLHAFDPRFHFYLLPLFGALAGTFLSWVIEKSGSRLTASRFIAGIGIGVMLFGIFRAGAEAQVQVRELENLAEFGESISAAVRLTESNASILTRKHTVPKYSGRRRVNLPNVESVAALCRSIQVLSPENPLYLYMGREERLSRQAMNLELESEPLPRWLELIDSRKGPAAWKLFRVVQPITCS